MLRRAMQGIGHEPADIVEAERRQHDLMNPRVGVADRLERTHEWMCRTDFVVAIGPDQKQVPNLGVRDQVFEQVEGRAIHPLQIVQEQGERMLLTREHAEEAPEYHLESVLGLLRRQFWN